MREISNEDMMHCIDNLWNALVPLIEVVTAKTDSEYDRRVLSESLDYVKDVGSILDRYAE